VFLILATPDDLHADAVLYYLKKSGARVIRLDTSVPLDAYPPAKLPGHFGPIELPGGATLAIYGSDAELQFPDLTTIRAKEVQGVFCRNFSFPKCGPEASTAAHLAAAESKSALHGFFQSMPRARWVNNPWREAEADNKIFQYHHAAAAGLAVPHTVVTNAPFILRQFCDQHQGRIIIKQMSGICLIEEEPFTHADGRQDCTVFGFYTQRVAEADLDAAEEAFTKEGTPCLFQEEIPKKSELRVTIIGDSWFAHRIDSQSHPKSRIDFRQVPDLPVAEATIPQKLGDRLAALIRSWGLAFAACDIIETPDGRHVFLEANVCGNWLWLEQGEESPVAEAIAAYLLRGV
jgi:hypothetical protein